MPNWCMNRLRVLGPKTAVDEFVLKFRGLPAEWPDDEAPCGGGEKEPEHRVQSLKPKPCFNALYPVPQEVREQGYDSVGYNWCVRHWGTEWDIYGTYVYEDRLSDGEAYYEFDTAWAPPVPWLSYISNMFPSLTFELSYLEPGVGFVGVTTIKGGGFCTNELYDAATDEKQYLAVANELFGYDDVADK